MGKCVCTKVYKHGNKVTGYELYDGANKVVVHPDQLKNQIRQGSIIVTNLQLTKDNRILDRALMSKDESIRKNRVPVDNTAEKQQSKALPILDKVELPEGFKVRTHRKLNKLVVCRSIDLGTNFQNTLLKSRILGLCNEICPDVYVFEKELDTFIVANAKQVILPESCEEMFAGCNAEEIIIKGVKSGPNTWNYKEMFSRCKAKKIKLPNEFFTPYDDENISFKGLFYMCSELRELNIGESFNLGCTSDYHSLFVGCDKLKHIKASYNAFVSDNTREFADDCGIMDFASSNDEDGTSNNLNTLINDLLLNEFVSKYMYENCVIHTPSGIQTMRDQVHEVAEALMDNHLPMENDEEYY